MLTEKTVRMYNNSVLSLTGVVIMTSRKIFDNELYDDMICLWQIKYKTDNGRYIYKYLMECTKCHRKKEMSASTILSHKGTSHSSCGKGLKLKDKKFYSIWQGMRTRTTNSNACNSKWYKDKGISSDSWKYFIDFYDDMYSLYINSKKNLKHPSIERIDYTKDYCKENCTFIELDKQQSNTSKNTVGCAYFDGNKYDFVSLHRFALEHNLNYSCCMDVINGRLKSYKGWIFVRKV